MSKPRHFLTLTDLTSKELNLILARAIELKQMHKNGEIYEPLKNKVLAMIFEKSSTRTRVSFESAMIQFGGDALFLSPRDTQLGRGEPVEDTARVLSVMVDVIMVRTFTHKTLQIFSQYSRAPVINGLSDLYHPCQLLADMQTFIEHRGSIKGKTVAWIGDGNNMCHSYINAAKLLEFNLNISCPTAYQPNQEILTGVNSEQINLFADPNDAVQGADLVVTDVWASMGQEKESNKRIKAFQAFQVNKELMNRANKDALFMHCLPAHRNEEVTAEVIDGAQSVVWDEAENRLHASKALLEFLLSQ